ncbi:MAG TPA: hypothetical protein VML75_02160, partial [Kofleriaceae bacterium]|nr:hypothetical protein [Kofleriaceae bacterium]
MRGFASSSPQEVLRSISAPLPDGWSREPVPCGYVHPALAAAIGEVLGLAADDVLAVARYEAWLVDGRVRRPEGDVLDDEVLFDVVDFERAGAPALRAALGDHANLLLDAIPVMPPASLPDVPSDDPAVRVTRPHPIASAYAWVTANVKRLARLHELSAPGVLIAA